MAKLNNGASGAVARGIINSLIAPPIVAVSANKTLGASDMQTRQRVTTGGSDLTVTLPSAATYSGESVSVQKIDTGAGKVIIENGVDLAFLFAQNDTANFQSDGTDWFVFWHQIAPKVQNFDVSGDWIKPPLATQALVRLIGAGGGGSRGHVNATTVNRGGGAGGSGGAYAESTFRADILSSTVPVTVGSGGAGSPAGTGASVAGSPGGDTTFGDRLLARGGRPGAQATTAAAGGASPNGIIVGGVGGSSGSNGGQGQAPLNSTAGTGTNLITGGGAGAGGMTSANLARAGANGAQGGLYFGAGVAGGTAGVVGGNAGGDGASQPTTFVDGFGGGGGGGGGGSSTTGNGGAGGAGGFPGGGGGGSAAASTGNSSGKGGDGASGAAQIVTYF